MENTDVQSTPMGRVWFIVFVSMCFTASASWIWHTSGMNDQLRRNKAADDAIIIKTEQIAHYRDLLKEKGKDAAAASLSSSSLDIYGN